MRRCGVRSRTRRCRYPSCRDRAVPAVCGLIWLGIARRSMLPALRRLHIGFAKRSTPIFFSRFTPSFIASADLSYFSLADLNNGQKNGSERTLQFRFLEMFGKVNRFQDLSFSEWLAHTPPEAVMSHLNIDKATYDAIPKNGGVVMPV